MNRLKTYISIAAFSTMVLLFPAIASAQYYPNGNQYPNDPNGRNGGYNNGQYGNRGAMRSTIKNLKSRAKDFQKQVDRDLDDDRRYNGRRRDDQMNDLAKRFKDAVNDLDNDGYRDNRGYSDRNSKEERDIRRVFDTADQVERAIDRSGVSYHSQNLWSSIRNDLQVLSRNYGTGTSRGNNGGWNNGGGWGNGRSNGGRVGLPSWWPF